MNSNCNRYMHERLRKEYHLNYNTVNRNKLRYDRSTHDIGCQFDSKCGNMICTCKNNTSKRHHDIKYFGGFPKQVYAYHKTNFTDIGMSSIKTVQKKKVKRIYLPETDNRGVGSSDLSSCIFARKPRYARISYYDHKKTSSKCVGGVRQSTVECVMSAKLSPLIRMNAVSTGPKTEDVERTTKSIEISSSTHKRYVTTTTQVENEYIKHQTIARTTLTPESRQQITKKKSNPKLIEKISKETVITPTLEKIRTPINKKITDAAEKVFSSDSLVQHVHNLDNPREDKQSRTSLDPMENKLEREYRRMFSTKSKETKLISEEPTPDLNSASLLRRRFEVLRRSVAQKDDTKENPVIINKELSPSTTPSKRDVSIASDPPSLEARSYSYTKANSAYESLYDQDTSRNIKSVVNKKERGSVLWSRTGEETDEEGVKGMFKLWGEKFDFAEENYRQISPTLNYAKAPKKVRIEPEIWVTPKTDTENKKGKKFFFFKKTSKDKTKKPYKPKKGVTAGRCEVKDGLMIKMGKVDEYSVHDTTTKKEPEPSNCNNISNEYEDSILRKAWLKKFLEQTIESNNSVQIRWNNKTYARSSSTVFEIMDNIYRQTEVILKSKSEMSTDDSSLCQPFKKHHVNFVQDIEAWMIPKLIPERPKEIPINISNKNIDQENYIKINEIDRSYFIDKSKAFAQKIEVVLHSKNFTKSKKDPSSDYLRINIPKGFFSDSINISDERAQMSNSEEVYKIVEYETPESDTKFGLNKALYTDDIFKNDIDVTISVKDNNFESKILESNLPNPILRRDVIIQGSNVYDPRLCDVIGVGIITHRDIRNIKQPILKIQYDYTDEDSDCEHALQNNQKTCEFAESYLQDVYRHWTPLGLEVYSGCVSDSHLQGCSDTSQTCINNQGDGTKSCPNICDDYQGSTIVSPCTTSSCSYCDVMEERHQRSKSKFFDKFKRNTKSEPNDNADRRVLPKDSLEVFKKRKLYACSNKSKWFYFGDKPYSTPSIEDKCEDTLTKTKTVCSEPKKKPCKKHVSIPDCDANNDLPKKLSSGNISGIKGKVIGECDACRNKDYCEKHKLTSAPYEKTSFTQSCDKKRNPESFNQNLPSCNLAKLSYNAPCTPSDGSPPHQKNGCPLSAPPYFDTIGSPRDTSASQRPTQPERSEPQGTPLSIHSTTKILTPPLLPRIYPNPSTIPPRHSPHFQSRSCLDLPPSLTPPPSCFNPPLCIASPPCISPKKVSLESIKSIFKNKTCSDLSPPCCLQPSSSTPKASKKKSTPISSPALQCSLKSSLLIIEKSLCDCAKEQFSRTIKKQISNESHNASCNNSPQKEPLQRPLRNSQTDCHTQEMSKCATPSPKLKHGLFLKKEARAKMIGSCPTPKREPAADSLPSQDSDENIWIRVKKTTPSTEEIREGMNIKVKDADGRTLYERRDYTTERSSMMGDMYNVHRVSTPRVQNVQLEETNNMEQIKQPSEISIANKIEIHFKLKLTHGNKNTEIQIDNEGENKSNKPEIVNDVRQTCQDVFVVKETGETSVQNLDDKNDINIKIVIKNFKPKSKTEQVNEDFSKKRADKFHSVSTAYSVIDDQVFSLHETTMEVKSSKEIMIQDITEKPMISTEMIRNIEVTAIEDKMTIGNTMNIERQNEILITGDMTESSTQNLTNEIEKQKSGVPICASYKNEEENILEVTSDNLNDFNSADNIPIPRSRQEKKELLKKVFEKAADLKKGKTRNRMHILRKMLKTILTSDSSDRNEIVATSNDLANDITYASLKPNYFRNTDSMNNYYNSNSFVNSDNESTRRPIYPTEEHSAVSKESDLSESCQPQRNCVCSTFAERLNLNKITEGGCCCRSVPRSKLDRVTCCDFRNEIDSMNYEVPEKCDIQIQNSININKLADVQSIADVKSSKISKNTDDISKKSYTMGNDSKNEVKSKILRRAFLPTIRHVKEYASRRLNKNTMLGITDEDKIYVLNSCSTKNQEKRCRRNETVYYAKAADILQSYETKKAVLEIYAEKALSRNGEHLVAKLPKFVYEKEADIERSYREIMP